MISNVCLCRTGSRAPEHQQAATDAAEEARAGHANSSSSSLQTKTSNNTLARFIYCFITINKYNHNFIIFLPYVQQIGRGVPIVADSCVRNIVSSEVNDLCNMT